MNDNHHHDHHHNYCDDEKKDDNEEEEEEEEEEEHYEKKEQQNSNIAEKLNQFDGMIRHDNNGNCSTARRTGSTISTSTNSNQAKNTSCNASDNDNKNEKHDDKDNDGTSSDQNSHDSDSSFWDDDEDDDSSDHSSRSSRSSRSSDSSQESSIQHPRRHKKNVLSSFLTTTIANRGGAMLTGLLRHRRRPMNDSNSIAPSRSYSDNDNDYDDENDDDDVLVGKTAKVDLHNKNYNDKQTVHHSMNVNVTAISADCNTQQRRYHLWYRTKGNNATTILPLNHSCCSCFRSSSNINIGQNNSHHHRRIERNSQHYNPWQQQQQQQQQQKRNMNNNKKKIYCRLNQYMTYVVCMSVGIWVCVQLSLGDDNNKINTTFDTTASSVNHDLNHLPVRERTRQHVHRAKHRSSRRHRNWFVQIGQFINDVFFGSIIEHDTTLPINVTSTTFHNSEDLPHDCIRSEWQNYNYPTCNDIFEIDLPDIMRRSSRRSTVTNQKRKSKQNEHRNNINTDLYYDDDYNKERIKRQRNTNVTIDSAKTVPQPIQQQQQQQQQNHLGFIAQGYWRSVWAVNPRVVVVKEEEEEESEDAASAIDQGQSKSRVLRQYEEEVIVLKTMLKSHELSIRNYDRHRRDAIVMEQLTSSPYVIDIYGYCGNSVLTEYIETTLEDIIYNDDVTVTTSVTNKNGSGDGDNNTNVQLLNGTMRIQLAYDMVRGIQALHDIVGGPIVHADIQAKQFLVSNNGVVKINDFNRCRFMAFRNLTSIIGTYSNNTDGIFDGDATTNITTRHQFNTPQQCKFRIPSSPGTSRSPEEYKDEELDEKLDMYSIGHLLYSILTYQDAWEGYHVVSAQKRMMDGETPFDTIRYNGTLITGRNALSDLPLFIQNWYINITKRAYTYNPQDRISASELASELGAMLQEAQTNNQK